METSTDTVKAARLIDQNQLRGSMVIGWYQCYLKRNEV